MAGAAILAARTMDGTGTNGDGMMRTEIGGGTRSTTDGVLSSSSGEEDSDDSSDSDSDDSSDGGDGGGDGSPPGGGDGDPSPDDRLIKAIEAFAQGGQAKGTGKIEYNEWPTGARFRTWKLKHGRQFAPCVVPLGNV